MSKCIRKISVKAALSKTVSELCSCIFDMDLVSVSQVPDIICTRNSLRCWIVSGRLTYEQIKVSSRYLGSDVGQFSWNKEILDD